MRHLHFAIPRRVPSTILSRFSIWLAGVFSLAQGAIIIVAGDERFSSSSFAVLSNVPGGMDTWGVVLTVFGVGILYGSVRRMFWLKSLSMVGSALWSISFAIGTLGAIVTFPLAAPTAPCVYFFTGASCLVLSLVDERNAP